MSVYNENYVKEHTKELLDNIIDIITIWKFQDFLHNHKNCSVSVSDRDDMFGVTTHSDKVIQF